MQRNSIFKKNKTIFKKNKIIEHILPDFKAYSKWQ